MWCDLYIRYLSLETNEDNEVLTTRTVKYSYEEILIMNDKSRVKAIRSETVCYTETYCAYRLQEIKMVQ
jgi:hypothetical protein